MKKLAKINKDYLIEMINNRESILNIKAFCKGAGIDTESYSSPVCILDGKISIRYRTINKYYYY